MGKPAATDRRRLKSLSHSFTLDLVIGCPLAAEARKMMAGLPQRFARFGLTMPPTQTPLSAFRKPEAHQGADSGNGPCPLLGLPHSWTESAPGGLGHETPDSETTPASHPASARALVSQPSACPAA